MAVLQVLPEVVGPPEFLPIAFAVLVYTRHVLEPALPVRGREVGKPLATVAANVVGRAVQGYGFVRGRGRERRFVVRDGGARPRVAAEMQRLLMSLRLIFIFEPDIAILAAVLLFAFVGPVSQGGQSDPSRTKVRREKGGYRSFSSDSNFLGFLGQQPQINMLPRRCTGVLPPGDGMGILRTVEFVLAI